LSGLVAGGTVYVLWPTQPVHQSAIPSGKRTNVGVQHEGNGNAPLPAPQTPYEMTSNGTNIARMDVERLTTWCRAWGLPDPPNIEVCEPTVVQALLDALQAAAASRSPEAFGRAGQVCESLDCHQAAEWYFHMAADGDPRDFRWPYYLGCIYQLTGRNDEAVRTFNKVINLNPDYALTYARLGQLYLEAGMTTEAQQQFNNYVAKNPHDCLGHVGLGRAALRRKEYDVALDHLLTAISYGQNDFQSHYYLAQVYTALGQIELAEKHFETSARLPRGKWFFLRDPLDQQLHRATDSTQTLMTEFEQSLATEDWEQFTALGERILERRPDDTTMMANLASLYRKQKRYQEAHDLLDRALHIQPDSLRLRGIRAEVYLAELKLDEALVTANDTLRIDSSYAAAHGVRGRALFLLNRLEEAQEAMRRAVELEPTNAGNTLVLGEILRARGQNAAAAECYKKVLELRPNDTTAQGRLAELNGS